MASLDFKTFFEIGKVSGCCCCYWFCFVFDDFVSDRDQTQGLTKLPQSHTPQPKFAVSGSLFLIEDVLLTSECWLVLCVAIKDCYLDRNLGQR